MAIGVGPPEPVLKVEELEGGPELVVVVVVGELEVERLVVEVEDETESVCTEDEVRTVGTVSL